MSLFFRLSTNKTDATFELWVYKGNDDLLNREP